MAPVKRRFPAKSTLRRAAASVVAVSALTLTSGCATFNPVQTNEQYVPADGVPADIGKVALRDLVLVSDGKGAAMLAGSAINTGTEKVSVQVSPQGEGGAQAAGAQLDLGPREQVSLATKGLKFSDVTAKPGRLVPVAVRSSDGGTTVVQVPVLTATGPYATVTPAG
jgi:hypothetical protein